MTTRISKIARISAETREFLNERIYNGEIGRTILKWLNDLPETKALMAELFDGKPITHQNLSDWRRAGYQDWLFHQQRLEWFDRFTEEDAELITHNGCSDTYEAMSRFFVFEIGQAMSAMQKIKNPEERFARLQNLTREFSRLQNAFNWSRRVALEYDKFYGPQTEEPNELPTTPKPVEETTAPTLGAPASRRQVDSPEPEITAPEKERQSAGALPDAPRPSEAEDQPASPAMAGDCGSPLPLSDVNSSTPKLVNSQTPTPSQAIPAPAPTTPLTNFPQIRQVPLPAQNSQTQNYKTHKVHSIPIRGRRFVCVEG